MARGTHFSKQNLKKRKAVQRAKTANAKQAQNSRPVVAYRQRSAGAGIQSEPFYAQEDWHEPTGRGQVRYVVQTAGVGYMHPVTVKEVRERLSELPERYTKSLEVIQFSCMTRKRALFPCYGLQWGCNVYLYPIEESLIETYVRPPRPEQLIEAKMFGGKWYQDGSLWRLRWTPQSIKDFYLNNVLIHEIGHVNDVRNTNSTDRERYANWFAIEYGYRRARRVK